MKFIIDHLESHTALWWLGERERERGAGGVGNVVLLVSYELAARKYGRLCECGSET